MYRAYEADPLHRIPERLHGFTPLTLDIDRRLKEIAANLGIRFISAYDVFCNDNGCLTRLGDTAKDIVQFDRHAPHSKGIMVFRKPHRGSDI